MASKSATKADLDNLEGITDTNTQLTEAQVDEFVSNNGYLTADDITDTDTQLSDSEVSRYC